jgi:amino acid transporter
VQTKEEAGPGGASARQLSTGAIGFPTALASAVGLIMASPVILTVTTGFGIGGSAFAVAIGIAFVLMQAQATTFAEAAAILPTPGSVYDFMHCGLGRWLAITGTLTAYVLVHVFAGTAETILSGTMALVNFPAANAALEQVGGSWIVGVVLVLTFATLNVFGVQAFGRAEIVLTFGMWLTLTCVGLVGLVHTPAVDDGLPFGASSIGTSPEAVLSLVGMAIFMFVGFEFVTPLAPELRQPARTIPRAMALGLTLVVVCMLIYGAAIRRQVPNIAVSPDGLVHLLDTPDAIPQFALRVLGPLGRAWLGVGFLFAGAATINTLMAGLPRILYGMAMDGALPRAFAYLHPRFKTPVVGIAVSAAIPIAHATLLHGNIDRIMPLVLAAVCAWGTAYILVNVAIVVLRRRRPDLARPYRSPLFPLPQVVSTAGILVAIWYVAPPGMDRSAVFIPFGIMFGCTALYALVWTRGVQRQPLFRLARVEDVLEREHATRAE